MKDETTTLQYLSFHLAEQEYGINIERVKEISRILETTSVPRVPNYVVGVMNLRGKVLPVIDLRLRFELPQKEADRETCVIVVDGNEGDVGIIVDSVNEVMTIAATEIQPAPSLGSEAFVKFVTGMVRRDEKLFMLLGVNNILAFQEYKNIPGTGEAA